MGEDDPRMEGSERIIPKKDKTHWWGFRRTWSKTGEERMSIEIMYPFFIMLGIIAVYYIVNHLDKKKRKGSKREDKK